MLTTTSFLPIARSAPEMRLAVTPSPNQSAPITSRTEMVFSASFSAAAWTSAFQRSSAEGMISVRMPGRAAIWAAGSLRLLIVLLLVEAEPVHEGGTRLIAFRLLAEAVERDHRGLNGQLVGVSVDALALVELRAAFVAGHHAVVDHLRQEGRLGRRIHLQEGFPVELGIFPAIAGRADQLLLDAGLDAITDRVDAGHEPRDQDRLDAGPPHGLALGRVPDHDRRDAEPAAHFLDVEAPGFQHLRVVGIERHALPLHAGFQDADAAGMVAALQGIDENLVGLRALRFGQHLVEHEEAGRTHPVGERAGSRFL